MDRGLAYRTAPSSQHGIRCLFFPATMEFPVPINFKPTGFAMLYEEQRLLIGG
jgi:hypothetical protein